jgi:transposase-like protein
VIDAAYDKIVAMYARGMTMREIQGFLLESYAVEVSRASASSRSSPCPLQLRQILKFRRPSLQQIRKFSASLRRC